MTCLYARVNAVRIRDHKRLTLGGLTDVRRQNKTTWRMVMKTRK